MTVENVGIQRKVWELAFVAGEALTGHIYKPMYLSAERTVKLMTAKALSQKFVGFLNSGDVNSETTIALGDHVNVIMDGVVLVVAQSSFSFGDYLTVADSQGRLDTAADNEVVVAMALEAADAINHIVSALIIRCPIKGDCTA